jgi:hypothetical protein
MSDEQEIKNWFKEKMGEEFTLPRGCGADDIPVCDFCLHFLFYRDKFGGNIDGSGWCGLKRKETDAGSGCDDYYCKQTWREDQGKLFS